MKAKNISTTSFEAKETEMPNVIQKENWNLFIRSVNLIADDVYRNRLYEVLSDNNIKNTSIVVSVKKILRYEALQTMIRKVTKKTNFRMEDRKKELLSKNGEPLFLCEIFISSETRDNVMKVKEILPMDHMYFRYKRCSPKRIMKVMNRDLSKLVFTNPIGSVLNMFDVPVVLDTVLNRIELANLVQLPLNPTIYSILPGESKSLSQGFPIEEE